MIFFILGTLCALVALWGMVSIAFVYKIEEPEYAIVKQGDGYELRAYKPYIVAETTVDAASERQALTQGFRIVAAYIFGANEGKETLGKHVPNATSVRGGTKIAMTRPVNSIEAGSGKWTIAFYMPPRFTSIDMLPKPTDERVMLRVVPAHTTAVRMFGWYATDARIEQEKKYLAEDLEADGIAIVGSFAYAGYNPPLSAPYVQRHEVSVAVIVPEEGSETVDSAGAAVVS